MSAVCYRKAVDQPTRPTQPFIHSDYCLTRGTHGCGSYIGLWDAAPILAADFFRLSPYKPRAIGLYWTSFCCVYVIIIYYCISLDVHHCSSRLTLFDTWHIWAW